MPTGFQDMKDYADKSVVRKYLRYQNTNFAFNEAEPICNTEQDRAERCQAHT